MKRFPLHNIAPAFALLAAAALSGCLTNDSGSDGNGGDGDSTRPSDQPELPQLFNKATSTGFVRGQLYVVASNAAATAMSTEEDKNAATAYLREPAAPPAAPASAGKSEEAALREKILQAKAKGYEGDSCMECGNFTLLRNGTCLKCDTCGSTSGCS